MLVTPRKVFSRNRLPILPHARVQRSTSPAEKTDLEMEAEFITQLPVSIYHGALTGFKAALMRFIHLFMSNHGLGPFTSSLATHAHLVSESLRETVAHLV